MSDTNDQLILIGGYSATGKSASLRNIRNQSRWVYLNTEAGKRLPFKNKFQAARVEDPMQVLDLFDELEVGNAKDDIDGVIIDSLTFLMDMYETMYVLTSANTMQAWGNYAQFFKILMQQKITRFGKPVIVIAHNRDDLDEKAHEIKTAVPIKGSLKNNGIEAYFSTVVGAKKLTIKDLEAYSGPLLNITEEERMLGFKYVFQTRITKTTVNERIRSPMGLFEAKEGFMDNDCQILLDHLKSFYS